MLREKNIHFINLSNGKILLFLADIFEIIEINESTRKLIKSIIDIKNENNIYKVSKEAGFSQEKVKHILSSINNLYNKFQLEHTKKQTRETVSIKLNMAHRCNLNCVYCYAEYNNENILMNETTSMQTVDFIKKRFKNADIYITFFGGEPFLNIENINLICKILKDSETEESSNRFKFAAITNGTLIDNEILDTIIKYDFNLRVSIDGPKDIHDKLRHKSNGEGSFDIIKKNLAFLKEKYKKTLFYESTYTNIHQKMGYTKTSIREFMEKELGFKQSLIADLEFPAELAPVYNKEEHKFNTNNNLDDLNEFLTNEELISRTQFFLSKVKSNYICSMGTKSFSITASGDIFPCQWFIPEGDSCKQGNVNNFNSQMTKFEEKIKLLEHEKNPKCQQCWARFMCKDCPLRVYKYTGDIIYNDHQCKGIKYEIEMFLKRLYFLKKDKIKYREIISKLKNLKNVEND